MLGTGFVDVVDDPLCYPRVGRATCRDVEVLLQCHLLAATCDACGRRVGSRR